jgi:hypothetical protein
MLQTVTTVIYMVHSNVLDEFTTHIVTNLFTKIKPPNYHLNLGDFPLVCAYSYTYAQCLCTKSFVII